jgi:ectoine hydroxylase-related dioxygenase (phytanoyl-CoA dioxygenase family)
MRAHEEKALPALHPSNHGFAWTPVRGPFRIINEEQARSFNERGFFVLEDALDSATVARVIAAIDPFEARTEEFLRSRPGGRMMISEADGISFTVHLVKRSAVLRELSASPLFADLCHDLIGPDVRLYWDQAVYKKPEYPKPFPWHQDNGYTYIEPQAYLTCWIALSDATTENGCPWVVPGGHLRGTLAHRLSELGYVCREEDGPEAIATPARAGSIVVFSSLMPHRTGPNVTKGVRKTYILQYAPEGAIVAATGAPCNEPTRQYLILKDGRRVPPPPFTSDLKDTKRAED